MTKHEEARIALNKFRNSYYNDIDGEKRDVAMALDVVLPYLVKTEKELEELKKREVPMRAGNDENYHYFTCPKCGVDWGYSTIPDEHNYCGNCGQKLDWSEENV